AVIPQVTAQIIGPNPPLGLTSLAGNGVEITGFVSDVRSYLAKATCFVAPLTLGSGIRNKILEAMAMKVPVVTTPIGLEGIAATPGKEVLLGQNPKEVAESIIQVFRDERLRNQLIHAAHELVQMRYTWQVTAARYEALYNEVLLEHQSRGSR